jgi:hypothetical protein
MAFKIKDGVRIGTVDVFDNAGVLLVNAPAWQNSRTVTFTNATTGDVTGSFSIKGDADVNNVELALETVLSGTGGTNEPGISYGSSSRIPVFTVDAKGRVTAITTEAASLEFTVSGDGPTSDLFQGGTVNFTGGTGILTSVAGTSSVLTTVTISLDSNDDVTFASVTADNIQIAPSTNTNLITTSSGDLNLDSASGTINLGVDVTDNVYIKGNLIVEGNTTTLNTSTLEVEDLQITIAKNATNGSEADGAGILVAGANATLTYTNTDDKFVFNKRLEATSIQNTPIGGTVAAAGTFTDLTVNGNTILGDAATDTITLTGRFVAGTVLRSSQTATDTLAIAAYDVDGAAYVNLITLTASNTPTLALTSTGVGTINNMSIGASTASTGTFTQLTVNGSNLNTTISPTGTSTVTISPGGQLTLGTATVTTSVVGNISAIGSNQTVTLSPTGTGTVTISPAGTLTLGTAGATTSIIGNITTGGASQTVNIDPAGNVLVTSTGGTFTLGTAGRTTTMAGNISATGSNQTVTLSPTGTGTVTINPAGAISITGSSTLTLGTSGQTTTMAGNISVTGSNQTVNLSPTGTGTVTLNPAGASTINNMSIGATTASTGRFTTIISTSTTNATSQSSGAVQIDGGVSVDADIYLSGNQVYATSGGTKIAETRALQYTVSQNTEFVLDTFVLATYRYAVYQIQITQGANIQVSEVRLAHNGTATTMTEYAVLETNSALAPAFTSDINSGNVRLKVTMTSASAATVNILRTLMVV